MDESRRINANLNIPYVINDPSEVDPLEVQEITSMLQNENRDSYVSMLLQSSPIRNTPDIHLNNSQGWNNTGRSNPSGSGLALGYINGSYQTYHIEPFQQRHNVPQIPPFPHFENNNTNPNGPYNYSEPMREGEDIAYYISAHSANVEEGLDRYIPDSGLEAIIHPQGGTVFPNIPENPAPYAQGELHQLVASQLNPQPVPNPNNSLGANTNPQDTESNYMEDLMYEMFELASPVSEEQLPRDDGFAELQDWSYEAQMIVQELISNAAYGLSEEEIASVLRTETFCRNSLEGVNALCCAICLEDYNDEEELRVVRKCDHKFHKDCIGGWLTRRSTCPLCRVEVFDFGRA